MTEEIMKKSLTIFLIIIGVIAGIISVLLLLSADDGGALYIKEIKDIDNSTYFEITPDELKEQPEIAESIRGGQGCIKSDYGGWYCELTSKEVSRVSTFFNIKHSKFLFNIDMKFKDNLDNSIIDSELVNTFKSNGFPLTEKYTTLDLGENYSPYNSWFIIKEANTPEYTVYEINNELRVYKSGYIDYRFAKIDGRYYEIQLAVT